MAVSERERISHVVRRLSMGAHPDLVAKLDSVDAAVAAALDLSAPAPEVPAMDPPADVRSQRPVEIVGTIAWWIDQMRSGNRLIEERLVWFWHDHFATSLAKVHVPYLLHQQHATVRAHASGSFADLLHAMAKDPALLFFLDGQTNKVDQINENFGRECLELFTMGIGGGYTQHDVVEASRSFSGWVFNVPGRRFSARLAAFGIPAWQSGFIPRRHDGGQKTLLGKQGSFDLDGALDVILGHPSTSRFVATKLYRELVGLEPDDATATHLGEEFARDWSIMGLVEAITSDGAFVSDAAVRARVRTPIEKLVGILQAGGNPPFELGVIRKRVATGVGEALRAIGFIPFVPPNVGGFPRGVSLLGPHQLVHAFDLLGAIPQPPEASDVPTLAARFGLFDLEKSTRRVIEHERDPARRFALAAMAPEFAVT